MDRGGTFTDVVEIADDGRVSVQKVPSDRAVVGELARGALTFGTTVATNALLERRVVPTLLVVTRGFADLPFVGDQARPELFDPDAAPLAPLCARIVEVDGRIDADGREIEPLSIPVFYLTDIASVAVVLINSVRNSSHERAVARAFPTDLPVVCGHLASPGLGYLARIETTLLDAAVTPVLHAAMRRDRIPDGAMAMRSDGSVVDARLLRAPDAVLSGPAGGVLAVEAVAAQAGFAHAVGLDMGGTSTDVCRVDVGRLPFRSGETIVAGVRLRRPMLEVETIAAGGGSILRNDGVRLTVGPDSAGADPGPQSRGRGGPPTLTDAALSVGLIDPTAFSPRLAEGAIDLPGGADEFLAIARDAMAAAVRRLATARGVDLANHALVAYGGAAGQHALEVAARLDIRTVLFHPCASVLSAWGQALARRQEAALRPIWLSLAAGWPAVRGAWAEMQSSLPVLGEIERSIELRYVGTEQGIDVGGDTADECLSAFVAEHHKRFGFGRPGHDIEIVNACVRVRAAKPVSPRCDTDPWRIGRNVVRGPRVIHTSTTSIAIPKGWTARREHGLLVATRAHRSPPPPPEERTPFGVELWGNRFAAIAEASGETLRRLARSVNIRERLDFSCAIFDGGGNLVANAPHIPVHLGAMGETVRDLLRRRPDAGAGQAWLTNDPAAGGSHLPDLTVVTAVLSGNRRWFVASRAHHVDVGGLTPGSMPPHSRTLADEGHVYRQVPLLALGGLVPPDLRMSRDAATVRADLEAQIAANAAAAHALAGLGPAALTDAWMAHLTDAAAESVAEVLATLSGTADDEIAGIPLRLRLSPGTVDFTGTGGPHAGNLNTPMGVVRAAILYALRVLVGRPIPVNEGALRGVRIILPERSILSPPPGAAIVGGNVETSQRIVDLMLRAAGSRAASQGTMNNLTFGGTFEGVDWTFYETIGGGQGASPSRAGLSGRQVHMTNTRATDVEVVEARFPLRVRRFELRRSSGGAGRHRGGDGLVREIEVLADVTASLLATRRDRGAPGLGRGGDGLPGVDEIYRDGKWSMWDGQPCVLHAGDRVCIATPGGGGWG